jgi:hypothetical protein
MPEVKSIQGQWSPLTWQDTKQNLEWSKLPSHQFSKYKTPQISATEYVLMNSRPAEENSDKNDSKVAASK